MALYGFFSSVVEIAQSLPTLRTSTLVEPRSQKTNALQRIGIANITILKNHTSRGVMHHIPRVCTLAINPNGSHLTMPVRNLAHVVHQSHPIFALSRRDLRPVLSDWNTYLLRSTVHTPLTHLQQNKNIRRTSTSSTSSSLFAV